MKVSASILAMIAFVALYEWVYELVDVTGRAPHVGMENNGRVKPNAFGAQFYKILPPGVQNVLLELSAERPVVKGRRQTTVER